MLSHQAEPQRSYAECKQTPCQSREALGTSFLLYGILDMSEMEDAGMVATEWSSQEEAGGCRCKRLRWGSVVKGLDCIS